MEQTDTQEKQMLLNRTFSISEEELMTLTNKYLQRENGDDDVIYFVEKGENKWL